MSAGMVHELNQPLAALRTLSDNAVVLIEKGRFDEARGNMERIGNLVDRLGRLTHQLKVFAHKSSEPVARVDVAQGHQGCAVHRVRPDARKRHRGCGADRSRGPGRLRRGDAAGAGPRQSARQCDRCGRTRRHAAHRDCSGCAGRPVRHRRQQHRAGHRRRHPAAPVRAVRHHEACRQGSRSRPDDLCAHRARVRRQPEGAQPARPPAPNSRSNCRARHPPERAEHE